MRGEVTRDLAIASDNNSGPQPGVGTLDFVDVPAAAIDTVLRTQTLIAGVVAFGMGSGGPKRQPGAEQVRWLTAVMLVPPGSATGPRVMAPLCALHAVIAVKVRPLSGMVKGCGVVPAAPAPPV